MVDTTQVVKDYIDKKSKLEKFVKNQQQYANLLNNSIEFKDKNIKFLTPMGTRTSRLDK
ncbi:DUF228 domain-containing protein, partial [Borreliella valaisiana]